MKIYKYILPLLLVLGGCSDFLDYKDKDKVIPSNLDEYNELIFGELIAKSSEAVCYNIMIMSDDVGSMVNGNERDYRDDYLSWYNWAKEPQMKKNGDELIDPAWEFFYHKILICNMIEEKVNEFEDDAEGMKFRLLGEVQAIRAMSYWYLINMYGEPWRSEEQAKTAMGVPVNTETSIVDKTYVRETLAKNYELIEADLKSALNNLEKGEVMKTVFRPNKEVIRLFLSRIYLEQKRFDKVITVCSDLLEETSKSVMTLERLRINYDNWTSYDPIISRDATNLLFSWWNRGAVAGFNVTEYSVGKFCVSPDLMAIATENSNDIRGNSYTFWNYNGTELYKYKSDYSKCFGMNYRVEEVYFNRAEAYLNTNQRDLAMADLTEVYKQRIMNEANPKLEAASDEEAVEIFRKEKRKEFCFEDIRWFDIRRWGLAVEHVYQNINNKEVYETYVLEAESPNYVLSLPMDLQRRNDKIEQPQRVETIVKN